MWRPEPNPGRLLSRGRAAEALPEAEAARRNGAGLPHDEERFEVGMPLVATYTGIVYWVFRGKVKLDENSY